MLHGITVQLEKKTEEGRDEFNRPVYDTEYIDVENVLVGKPGSSEIIDTLNLTGKKIEYILGIPKGDTNDWTDKKVRFWNQEFHTVGPPETGIQDLIPMDWGMNVKVEHYGKTDKD